jgi:hypothetical protein
MTLTRSKETLIYRFLASGFCGLAVVLFLLPSAPLSASAEEDLKAPGDCTQARHKELQDDVETACNRGRKCLQPDSCKVIKNKINLFNECIDAREAINRECFRGGNAGHKKAINDNVGGRDKCEEILKKKQEDATCLPECPKE